MLIYPNTSDCFFSDQRNLGMSMKVERSTVDQVRARFESNKRKKEDEEKNQVSFIMYFKQDAYCEL